MKPGARALGVAESYRTETSTFAGCVVRANRVVDGFAFGTCTVGGTDATDAILRLYDRLDREDVQYLFVAGIAPAWFNVVDLRELADETGLPVLSVSFEDSEGLEESIQAEFDDEAARERLEIYKAQPERMTVDVGEETLYLRSRNIDDRTAVEVLRGFTPAGGRPEPLRVARQAARAVDEFREG